MKKNTKRQTITLNVSMPVLLTVITIAGLTAGSSAFVLPLWIAYGVYKILTS